MSNFDALLNDIEALDICPRFKSRVIRVLARYTGMEIYFSHHPLKALERRELIAKLKRGPYSRAELTQMLSERWGVSRRTASRWIGDAK